MNWLEIEATRHVIGCDRAHAAALRSPVYGAIYRTILDDFENLRAMFAELGIAPIPPSPDARLRTAS